MNEIVVRYAVKIIKQADVRTHHAHTHVCMYLQINS